MDGLRCRHGHASSAAHSREGVPAARVRCLVPPVLPEPAALLHRDVPLVVGRRLPVLFCTPAVHARGVVSDRSGSRHLPEGLDAVNCRAGAGEGNRERELLAPLVHQPHQGVAVLVPDDFEMASHWNTFPRRTARGSRLLDLGSTIQRGGDQQSRGDRDRSINWGKLMENWGFSPYFGRRSPANLVAGQADGLCVAVGRRAMANPRCSKPFRRAFASLD